MGGWEDCDREIHVTRHLVDGLMPLLGVSSAGGWVDASPGCILSWWIGGCFSWMYPLLITKTLFECIFYLATV